MSLVSRRSCSAVLAVLLIIVPLVVGAQAVAAAGLCPVSWSMRERGPAHRSFCKTTPNAAPATPTAAPTAVTTPKPPPSPSDTATTYRVEDGDTPWSVGMKFGLSPEPIVEANPSVQDYGLQPGTDIVIPWSNPKGTAYYRADNVPVVNGNGLHFVVSISQQSCWLFRDGGLQERWTCSTGRPESPSIPGNYTVQSKMPRGYGGLWDFWMPNWLGLYDAGGYEDGIHGLPYNAETGEKAWINDVGNPVTFGCVMLDDAASQKLYATAFVGMPVTILP